MSIYDKNNEVLTEIVSSATSKPDVIEIINRTFDGSYNVQTIGESGTKLDVIAYFTSSKKLLLDAIKRSSDTIKVTFDGRYYIGIIEGEISWDRLANQDAPLFGIQFTLLVESEGVL